MPLANANTRCFATLAALSALSGAVFTAATLAGPVPASAATPAGGSSKPTTKLAREDGSKAVVTIPGARIVINKATAEVLVRSPDGKKILRTKSAAGQDGSTVDGEDSNGTDRPAYSGIGFTVGPEPELSYPLLPGDPEPPPPLTAALGDGRYSAQKVLSVRHEGTRVRVVMASDDPGGRRIALDISAGRTRTAKLRASVSPDSRVTAVAASFTSDGREAFHGFGGRREGTDVRGSDFKSWVLDYRFPDGSVAYYAPYPGFISSRGYGFLLGGDRIGRWRMASDRDDAWRVSAAGPQMGMTVSASGPRHAIRALSEKTGRHRVAPKWSTGPMLSRTIGLLVDQDHEVYRQKVEADLTRIERGDLEISSYAFEGWAALPPDFVRQAVRRLKKMGIRTVLYARSFVANDTAGTDLPGAFEEVVSKGYAATHKDGSPYLVPSPFPGGDAAIIDFTNPDARRWWERQIAVLLDTGATGFMNDFGEQVVPDMHFADGSTGVGMHNRFPALQAKVTRRAVNDWRREHPNTKVFFFQRAGFSGRPGSAGRENAQFPGDETVDWEPGTGLPSIVPDMLNRAVIGAPGFTVDIGGYTQFNPVDLIIPPTDSELFTRWAEAAVFTPFFRVHNSGLDGVRMPWDFDQATLNRWKKTVNLHQRARPLIRRLWEKFVRTGMPMTRPMWLVDPQGARGPRGDDQWLLGNNLLAAPVMVEGADSRPVRLPSGCWRLHGKGRNLRGKRTIDVSAPLGTLPWFTRCGTDPLRG